MSSASSVSSESVPRRERAMPSPPHCLVPDVPSVVFPSQGTRYPRLGFLDRQIALQGHTAYPSETPGETAISEAEALREFRCSDSWLRKQLREKKLTAYEKGADRRVYVLRSELEQLMSPRATGMITTTAVISVRREICE